MKQKSIKGRNLNRSLHYSRERLKKATKRQYLCSLRVPWKASLKISPAAQATPTR